jgi:hypothetical protein
VSRKKAVRFHIDVSAVFDLCSLPRAKENKNVMKTSTQDTARLSPYPQSFQSSPGRKAVTGIGAAAGAVRAQSQTASARTHLRQGFGAASVIRFGPKGLTTQNQALNALVFLYAQVSTTQIYTHAMSKPGLGARSPLDA